MWFTFHFPVLIVLLPGSVSFSLSSKRRTVCLSSSYVHWFPFKNNLGLWTGWNLWYALISSLWDCISYTMRVYSEDQGCGCTILHPCHSQSLCLESSADITVKSRSWQHLQGCQKLGFYCTIGNISKKIVKNLWLYKTPVISIFYSGDLGESYNY